MYINYEINDSGLNSLSQLVNLGLKKLHIFWKNKEQKREIRQAQNKEYKFKNGNINNRQDRI